MTNEQKSNILVPMIILLAFIAFIGFISFSLYTQVVDNEAVIELRDIDINGLRADVNSTAMLYEGKKSELIVANANVAALTADKTTLTNDKNTLQTNLTNKTNDILALTQTNNNLETQFNDLNQYSFIRDINYDTALNTINDINSDGHVLYNLFTSCLAAAECNDDINMDCVAENTACLNISELDQNRADKFK